MQSPYPYRKVKLYLKILNALEQVNADYYPIKLMLCWQVGRMFQSTEWHGLIHRTSNSLWQTWAEKTRGSIGRKWVRSWQIFGIKRIKEIEPEEKLEIPIMIWERKTAILRGVVQTKEVRQWMAPMESKGSECWGKEISNYSGRRPLLEAFLY